MVVHDNHVIHTIFFGPIKLTMMGQIFPRFIDFDEGPINKSNVALKFWKLCCQNSLFNNGPLNLVSNGRIYARCNKYVIIIIALLFQFQMKASYLITLSCFINKMKLNKRCSEANLDGRPKV
jgi:hypothetical protein